MVRLGRIVGLARTLLAPAIVVGVAAVAAENVDVTELDREDLAAIDRLVARIEASPARCRPLPERNTLRRTMAAEVERFRALVPQAQGVPIDVLDCYWDGMVVQGERIVLSARLARATPEQRFFLIAHEYAHVHLHHHDAFAAFATRLYLTAGRDEQVAARQIGAHAADALSRHNESEADAFAAQLMLSLGMDPSGAAAFFEQHALPLGSHPAPHARADAIRALAAAAAPIASP